MEDRGYIKSLSMVQDAMKNIKQEMVIKIGEEHHIVYITDIIITHDAGIAISYNTLDESKRDELYPHIEKCVRMQIEELMQANKSQNRFEDYFY